MFNWPKLHRFRANYTIISLILHLSYPFRMPKTTKNEIVENENANKTFLIRSPELELIQMYLTPGNKSLYESAPEKVEFMTATEILTYLNEKNRSNIKLTNVNVGKSLKMLGFQRDSYYESEQQMSLKGYFVIKKKNQENFDN